MAIILEKLSRNSEKIHQMKLISGQAGMNNIVQWVHMIEDENVADFLHGNELVFTTGIGHTGNEWIVNFVKRLYIANASGIVLNLGVYITEVPEDAIKYCNEVGFPLFTVPWEVRLVDITRDFCRRIITSEQVEVGVASAFKNAIFYPNDAEAYRPTLERHGFDLDGNFCAVSLALESKNQEQHAAHIKSLKFYMTNIVNRISERYGMFTQDKYSIIILANFTKEQIESFVERLMEVCSGKTQGYKLYIGIGTNYNGLDTLIKSYKKSISVLNMAIKKDESPIYYDDLEIQKILLSTDDNDVLKEFYFKSIGKIAEYDKENSTDYLHTLKLYLENNASVKTVADKTFVHRNTINYKLRKIEEITDCNLSDVEQRLKFALAFYIKDIL